MSLPETNLQQNSTGEQIPVVELEGFAPADLYQRREKIFTRYVGGFYQRLRFFTGWPLLLGYFLLPWINWGGRQSVLFDLPARQFHILGVTYWPEDLWLLGWLLIISAFGLFTITTVVGRLWCGYTCPQTVWTAIFMWVEQVTEGSRNQRIKLDQAPWSFEKIIKRTAKHTGWLIIAAATGLTFVGYFTPIRELVVELGNLGEYGWANFWFIFFTAATYINAGWLREQVCIYMCPYARFQSAMVDANTLVVSYAPSRGEPRGLQKKGTLNRLKAENKDVPTVLGDCIDCSMCVQVCPTGIDIRDGLQYQCIGCAHCIDACNQVMAKLGREPGLISYTTLNTLAGGVTRFLNPRSVGYATATAIMLVLFFVGAWQRDAMGITITRDRASLYQAMPDGRIRNDFSLKLINKSNNALDYELALVDAPGLSLADAPSLPIPAQGAETMSLSVYTTAANKSTGSSEFKLEVCAQTGPTSAETHCMTEKATFYQPTRPKGQ